MLAYEFLVGNPPFENHNQYEAYTNIADGRFEIPKNISRLASDFIRRILKTEPKERMTIE